MATKKITIIEEAYEKLKIRKKSNESFSDVIYRALPDFDWSDFAGILSEESAEKLRDSVEESKRSWDEPLRFIGKRAKKN